MRSQTWNTVLKYALFITVVIKPHDGWSFLAATLGLKLLQCVVLTDHNNPVHFLRTSAVTTGIAVHATSGREASWRVSASGGSWEILMLGHLLGLLYYWSEGLDRVILSARPLINHVRLVYTERFNILTCAGFLPDGNWDITGPVAASHKFLISVFSATVTAKYLRFVNASQFLFMVTLKLKLLKLEHSQIWLWKHLR